MIRSVGFLASHEFDNPHQHHRAYKSGDERPYRPYTCINTQNIEQVTADECTHNANDEIANQSKISTFNDLACQPTRDESYDNKNDKVHEISFLLLPKLYAVEYPADITPGGRNLFCFFRIEALPKIIQIDAETVMSLTCITIHIQISDQESFQVLIAVVHGD